MPRYHDEDIPPNIPQNLRNQIMTTNLWVVQHWFDHKLVWDPAEFGGVSWGRGKGTRSKMRSKLRISRRISRRSRRMAVTMTIPVSCR